MPFRYMPFLRAKAGEAVALRHLTPAAKNRMLPVIHLATTVTNQLVGRLGHAWAGREIALDGVFNFGLSGSGADYQTLATGIAALGVIVIPSIEVGSTPGYLAAISPQVQAAGGRVIVKVRIGQLQNLLAWVASVALQPQDIDLVVVAGHIADFGQGVLDQLLVHSLQNLLPQPQSWRSITLAGSAAPKDYSNLGHGQNHVPRLDWLLWQAVQPQVGFQLDYADYGIAHPDMTEPPGYVMGNATVSVRYSLDNEWLIIKGRPVSGNTGIPMPAQYLSHANALIASPMFNGLPTCWGDDRISQIAGAIGSSGSRHTWVEIGVNRHLELVADRLP